MTTTPDLKTGGNQQDAGASIAGIPDAGAVAAMRSLRHRLRLLDTMTTPPPSPSGEIARHLLPHDPMNVWFVAGVTARD